MAASDNLPAELLETIFQHLDTPSLLQCIYASPSRESIFFKCAEAAMYTHIAVPSPDSMLAFATTLVSRSDLLRRVQSCVFWPGKASNDNRKPKVWKEGAALIVLAVHMLLPYIKTLQVPDLPSHEYYQAVTSAITTAPNLEHFSLGHPFINSSHPAIELKSLHTNLLAIPNLRKLDLHSVNMEDLHLSPVQGHFQHLEELMYYLYEHDDTVEDFFKTIGPLKYLSVDAHWSHFEGQPFQAFLNRQSSSLRHLVLESNHDATSHHIFPSMPTALVNLKRLEFRRIAVTRQTLFSIPESVRHLVVTNNTMDISTAHAFIATRKAPFRLALGKAKYSGVQREDLGITARSVGVDLTSI